MQLGWRRSSAYFHLVYHLYGICSWGGGVALYISIYLLSYYLLWHIQLGWRRSPVYGHLFIIIIHGLGSWGGGVALRNSI